MPTDRTAFVLDVPLPPAGLGPNGRCHWRVKASLKADYLMRVQPIINAGTNPPTQWEKAHVHYDWYSIHQVDADNAIGRLKPLLDALQGRAFVNDRDVSLSYQWHKVGRKHLERVEVTIKEAHHDQ